MMNYVPDNESNNNPRIASKLRFAIFAVFFSLAGLALIGRYAYLMLIRQETPRVAHMERPVGRGPILDRNGRLLALETRMGNVTLRRAEVENLEQLSRELAPLLEQSPAELFNRINNSQSPFMYLKRQVNEPTIRLIQEGIREGRLRGVGIEPVLGRIYPERNLAAQVIGFVGHDNTGLAGIEFALNRELSPEPRGTLNRRTGNQVFLTLDLNVQYILENIAHRVKEENMAEAVIFMAMDPRTGDILGSVSLPSYDPNNFRNSDENSRIDRPAMWAYEPGSVFKIFSLAAMLDAGVISENTFFTCNGYYERITGRGERIVINCMGRHGRVNARDIIVVSCNAGAAYASDRMSSQAFYQSLRDFGFGSRTGAGNPGETAGFLRTTDRWSERSKPTIAMGQEIAVSALQILQAASAIANDGVLVPPRIVSRIVSPDGVSQTNFENGQPRRVISPETARAMRNYMIDVTSSAGTGWRAFMDDISLAVKTGTSQVIDPATGTYSETDFIASCIGLIPAESPNLVLYIAIIKPRGASHLAGRIAAPPIREAAEAIINIMGTPRGRSPQIFHSGAISIPILPNPVINDFIPDFTGVAKRQLLPLLLREDLRFHISGEGWVVRQSPAPGTLLTPETLIVLELE